MAKKTKAAAKYAQVLTGLNSVMHTGTSNEVNQEIEDILMTDDWETPQKAQAKRFDEDEEIENSPLGQSLYSMNRKQDKLKKMVKLRVQKQQDIEQEDQVHIDSPSVEMASTPVAALLKEHGINTGADRGTEKRFKDNRKLEKLTENPTLSSSSESDSDDEVIQKVDKLADLDHEVYFKQQKTTAVKTSNHTLAFNEMSREEFLKALASFPDPHAKYTKALVARYTTAFGQWELELTQGFNLLFYGFGSKISLLSDFIKDIIGPLITINGFFPLVPVRTIISSICTQVCAMTGTLGNTTSQIKAIHEYLESPIVLLVHNLELLKPEYQTYISHLANHPLVYLVASVDHMNAALLWDSSMMQRFNFCWHDVTTFSGYLVETSFENNLTSLRTSKGGGGARGGKFVLESLTQNTKRLFDLLARYQMQQQGCGTIASGLTFEKFFTKASNDFIVSEVSTFRTMLTEFKDHELIVTGTDGGGEECLWIPMDQSEIQELLE